MDQSSIVYLVYFNCRGTGHYYRYAIYEIGVPYEQIHIEADGTIPESLRQYGISLADIPCIIHEGRIVKQLYIALRYLCKRFNRLDLLGNTLAQQTKISEIYCKYSKKKSVSLSTFLKYVPKIMKQPENIKKLKEQMIKEMTQKPGAHEACEMLYSQTGNFLLDHLTIIDFLFYENCFYSLGFFSDVFKKRFQMQSAYKNFFERTDFYQKHKDKIQRFQFIIPEFDASINQGFRLMWQFKKSLK